MKSAAPKFFNRELSWIEFNARVLSEAANSANPLLERLKFCGIVSSNFDEFFMVRVAGLMRQVIARKSSTCPTGLSPAQQLDRIRERTAEICGEQQRLIDEELIPELSKKNVQILSRTDFDRDQESFAFSFFRSDVSPVLTPLRIEDTFPLVVGRLIHVFVRLQSQSDTTDEPKYAMVRIPPSLPRFVRLPSDESTYIYTTIEDIVIHYCGHLFPGYRIDETLEFRLIRDADLGVDEERDEDFLLAMEEMIIERQTSFPVRIESRSINSDFRRKMLELISLGIGITPDEVYVSSRLLDASSLVDLSFAIDRPELHDPPWPAVVPPFFQDESSVFDIIRAAERILHHPYESFEPVVKLLSEASTDPDVLAIKITLYRTSGDSPIVRALKSAAENGKQVTVFVELKARFDEEQNINWAQELEQAGAIVVYGIANLKVHAKVLLVIRREHDGICRYVHLSTGNYNDKTARIYSDIGLLTCDAEMSADVAAFFNAITGYSSIPMLRALSMSPVALKSRIISLIERESARFRETGNGRILVKLNSLADTDVIEALYEASKSGVEIRMNIRGICMLVPGVPEMSENIEVVSIVDRYLEHSRIFYFGNGGADELYLSSADWMPRNLDRRIELLFPVRDEQNKGRIVGILDTYFADTEKSHRLDSGAFYTRSHSGNSKRAQEILYQEAVTKAQSTSPSVQKTFTVRRSRVSPE